MLALSIADQGDRRHARREYVGVILNDFVTNPGPDQGDPDQVESSAAEINDSQLGLMQPFVSRWRRRLPDALAAAAGARVIIPSGNDELVQLLNAL